MKAHRHTRSPLTPPSSNSNVDNVDKRGRRSAATLRREADQRIVERLLAGGVSPEELFLSPDPDNVETAISDDGLYSECWGRPLRRWLGFVSQAHTEANRKALRYQVFCAVKGIRDVVQVRVSPPACRVPLHEVRGAHGYWSDKLTDRLRYACRRIAPDLRVDIVDAHVCRDSAWTGYLHFHLAVRGRPEAFAAFEEYLTRGSWDVWYPENSGDHHPAALAWYDASGLTASAQNEEWSPEELAELYRQTRGLAMSRAVGEYRQWVHEELASLDQTVIRQKDGSGKIVPRCPRLRVQRLKSALFQSVGFVAIRRAMHDFGDGRKRATWVVRGRPDVTINEIWAVYSTRDTAKPESAPSDPEVATQGLRRDPPPSPRQPDPIDTMCPW